MKTILFSILVLFSVNAFSFNWKKVGEAQGNYIYVDVDNIKKHNGLVYLSTLIDLFEPSRSGANSYIHKWDTNCFGGK